MKITLVKKITKDGTPCRKCLDVENRLRESGYLDSIDRIVIADENDPNSEGMLLAQRYQVEIAPFFMVESAGREPEIHTVYFRFLREVLEKLPEIPERENA